ncbi:hypothetical protein ABIF38_006442 [Bradyrhizobium japonicum]|uniref:hypothetical protein n=1 Tax=Bradyrhizobium elkanii TaxID=29448 RepID=UPI000376E82C|nr:hypothetical protein [Bradyrhizobium elkanii]WAX24373.1 hypothetical protein [Bradyrhizobium phage ppBeUSDA76-1]MCP1731250.1 hypothetical protein [Bradyrhizobium elkanii]MCS3575379.1 hypothetical protein [Bradyrhizobium elkanii]MCS3591930.1 hypothetical protein [Bradyrhizobium elkanii]MCS3621375.1 hypothetical protein [Bradyrhizobium elkanii]
MGLFNRDPLKQMTALRDQAERLGVQYLEGHAVKGTITRQMVFTVAKALNFHPDQLIEMIPDRRRAGRHAKAMDGLRKANLAGGRGPTFADYEQFEQQN